MNTAVLPDPLTEPVLLATSHGTSDPAGQRAVAGLVAAVAEATPHLRTLGGFVDVQQPDVAASIDEVDQGQSVVIVPLLLSAGYHVRVDLARAARLAKPGRVVVTGALGPDTRLAGILALRLVQAGLRPEDTVVLAAAGSSDASAVADCEAMGRLLAAELGREVTVGFVSAAQPPLTDAVAAARRESPGNRVIIATYLLAPGYFAGLVGEAGADVVSAPLLVDGQAPPAPLVDIVVDRYLDAASSLTPDVPCNGHVSVAYQPSRRAVTTS